LALLSSVNCSSSSALAKQTVLLTDYQLMKLTLPLVLPITVLMLPLLPQDSLLGPASLLEGKGKGGNVDLYSASSQTPLTCSGMARVIKGSYSFTCTPRIHPYME